MIRRVHANKTRDCPNATWAVIDANSVSFLAEEEETPGPAESSTFRDLGRNLSGRSERLTFISDAGMMLPALHHIR